MSQLSKSIQNLTAEGFVRTEKVIKGITNNIIIGVTWVKDNETYHQFPNTTHALLEIGEAVTC